MIVAPTMVAATSWEGTPPSTNTAPAATSAAEASAEVVEEDGSPSVCVDQQRAPHPSISLRDIPLHDACRSLTQSSSSSTGTSTAILPHEEATRRRRRRSGSGERSKDGTSFDESTQNAPMSWERQGSSIHPVHMGGSAGNGDSSDTLGVDSDDEKLDEEGEMVVAVAAAAAAAAAAGGTTKPGVEGLSIKLGGGLEGLGSSPSPMVYGYCNSKSPVSRVTSPIAALSTFTEMETPCPLRGAVAGRSPVGNRLVMPSILPHPEALPFIRERSQQLYVPLPVAISRTFGEENNSMIDRRAWLEVEDRKHRYAKNLRLYYKEWDRRGQPGKSFWSWLDEGDIELEDCSRAQLEAETVYYCSSDKDRKQYEVRFMEKGLLHRFNAETGEWGLVDTGPDGWIFVLRDGIIYAHEKKTDHPPRFHHSSFFAGECVQAAGLFVAGEGVLERLYPHSGHYRPTDSHLLSLLLFLESQGVDMERMQVDFQLVMKVARSHDAHKGGRRRKIDSPYMWTGLHAKYFLLVKRYTWENKLFDEMLKHRLCLCSPGS
ncbi:hypothetical protein VYU27_003687 [Nannochloropsis oceanica]